MPDSCPVWRDWLLDINFSDRDALSSPLPSHKFMLNTEHTDTDAPEKYLRCSPISLHIHDGTVQLMMLSTFTVHGDKIIIITTWRYSPTWALACCAIRLHWSLSWAFLLHSSIPISCTSSWTWWQKQRMEALTDWLRNHVPTQSRRWAISWTNASMLHLLCARLIALYNSRNEHGKMQLYFIHYHHKADVNTVEVQEEWNEKLFTVNRRTS